MTAEVCCASNSEIRLLYREVGFALNNGHRQPSLQVRKGSQAAVHGSLQSPDCPQYQTSRRRRSWSVWGQQATWNQVAT